MPVTSDMLKNAIQVSVLPSNAIAVTPHDTNKLTSTMMLYIGTAGDVKVDMATSGTAIVFKNVPNSTFLPVRVTKVYSTGTTATNIVGIH